MAISSFAMKGDKERFIKAGFNDYISKPLDVSEFIKKVKNIVLMSNEAVSRYCIFT
ncbi:MAG: hypothetical protein KKG76_11210 [Euryarchaeota archaeon]|nr:hypothetical protein [Euryarchaeota archaeon]MBU4138804.1 hypothetical protein [Euryarchaeota archaeon]